MDKSALLVVRPYSLTGIAAIGLLAHITANSRITDLFFFDILIALSMWVTVNVFAEFVQNDTANRKKDATLLIVSIAVFSILILLRNPTILLALPVLIIIGWAYSLKTKKTPISRFSFLVRGFVEVLIFLVVFLSQSSADNLLQYTPYIISIYAVTCARNLVGDLRDIKVDKFTFPVIFGENLAKAVILGLLSLAVISISNLQVVFPLLAGLIIMLFLISDNYNLHKFFVLSTLAFVLNVSAFSMGETLLLTNLMYLGALLMHSYEFVPRRISASPYLKKQYGSR